MDLNKTTVNVSDSGGESARAPGGGTENRILARATKWFKSMPRGDRRLVWGWSCVGTNPAHHRA